ncbi:MAG TPA: Chromate resistance protein ChrB, partial [Thermoanaerobaculia bacterium]|nr:Chromate resistance protein ChrB [Thermoanaerobaculia bacterium]
MRVKIGRRLHRLGAIAVKNSVWALPNRAAALEDLGWVAEEIQRAGGDASLLSASFVLGLRDADVQALFMASREGDYRKLLAEVRVAEKAAKRQGDDARDARDEPPVLARLRRRAREIEAIDFFGLPIR